MRKCMRRSGLRSSLLSLVSRCHLDCAMHRFDDAVARGIHHPAFMGAYALAKDFALGIERAHGGALVFAHQV